MTDSQTGIGWVVSLVGLGLLAGGVWIWKLLQRSSGTADAEATVRIDRIVAEVAAKELGLTVDQVTAAVQKRPLASEVRARVEAAVAGCVVHCKRAGTGTVDVKVSVYMSPTSDGIRRIDVAEQWPWEDCPQPIRAALLRHGGAVEVPWRFRPAETS